MVEPQPYSTGATVPPAGAPEGNQRNMPGLIGFIISLVAVPGFCIPGWGLLGAVGAIVSAIGLRKRPKGLAIAGLIIGIIVTLWAIGYLVVVFMAGGSLVQIGQAGFEMTQLQQQIEAYQQNNAQYPATLADLAGATPDMVVDPWGQPYIYEVDQANNAYRLGSTGPDGLPATTDDFYVSE